MDILAGEYDVICTEKLILTEAIAEIISYLELYTVGHDSLPLTWPKHFPSASLIDYIF
jgi:hypothetical protein